MRLLCNLSLLLLVGRLNICRERSRTQPPYECFAFTNDCRKCKRVLQSLGMPSRDHPGAWQCLADSQVWFTPSLPPGKDLLFLWRSFAPRLRHHKSGGGPASCSSCCFRPTFPEASRKRFWEAKSSFPVTQAAVPSCAALLQDRATMNRAWVQPVVARAALGLVSRELSQSLGAKSFLPRKLNHLFLCAALLQDRATIKWSGVQPVIARAVSYLLSWELLNVSRKPSLFPP